MRLVNLLLLSLCAQNFKTYANPVSSPEISSKSIKAQQANNINIQQQQQQQQHQQQQQQKQQHDAHLNSLTAYATNYDNIASAQAQVQPQLTSSDVSSSTSSVLSGIASSVTTGNSHFKPSYKLPEMETNFTPIQSQTPTGSGTTATLQTTPMLMQYLPAQALPDGTSGSVQYLQLIPTRPIIVPISPYLSAGGTPSTNSYTSLAPAAATSGNTLSDYAVTPMLSARHPGNHPILNYATTAGLHAFANSIVPYTRMNGVSIGIGGGGGGGGGVGNGGSIGGGSIGHHHFHRINRETKEKHFPSALSLNLNEYLPGVQDAAHAASAALAYMRGRP